MHLRRTAADVIRNLSDRQLELWLRNSDDLFIRRVLTGPTYTCGMIIRKLLIAEGERRMETVVEFDQCGQS